MFPGPTRRKQVMEEYISSTVEVAGKNKTCIEVNANGFLWAQINDDWKYNLFDMTIDAVKKHDTNVTIGSDAHTPELVAKAFPQIIDAVKSKGIETVSVFEQRQGRQVKLG